MKSFLKFGILIAIVGVYTSMPNFVSAGEVITQTAFETTQTTGQTRNGQALGTGLSGYPFSATVYFVSSAGTAGINQVNIMECTASNYTSCTLLYNYIGNAFTTLNFTTSPSIQTFNLATTSGSGFNSSRYYFITYCSGQIWKALGSSASSTIPSVSPYGYGQNQGTCAVNPPVMGNSNVKQSYLRFVTSNNYLYNEGIVKITTPTYGQVLTSGAAARFSFDYFITGVRYNRAGFYLLDNTTGQSIDTTAASSTINATGVRTYDFYFDLVTGHNYTWTPYLLDTRGVNKTIMASSTFFFTGSNQSRPAVSTPVNPWAGQTLISMPIFATSSGIVNWTNSTSSSFTSGIFDKSFDELMARKAPFSYLYDMKQLLYEFANGSATSTYTSGCSSQDGYYQLPFGKVLSTGSSSVKIFDACAVSAIPAVAQIKEVMKNGIYLMTGIGLASMAMSLL